MWLSSIAPMAGSFAGQRSASCWWRTMNKGMELGFLPLRGERHWSANVASVDASRKPDARATGSQADVRRLDSLALRASHAKPARTAARDERLLVRAQGKRRLVIGSSRRGAGEKIHLDLADAPAAKFDIASPDPIILDRLASL